MGSDSAHTGSAEEWDLHHREEVGLSIRAARTGHLRPTFYIATSFSNGKRVQQLAGFLMSRGLRWVYGHNWTQISVNRRDDPRAPMLAQQDLQGAISADLFVLLPVTPLTAGCHVELGARVAAGKEAHLIRDGATEWHLFHSLPGVIEHDSVDDFVLFVFGA